MDATCEEGEFVVNEVNGEDGNNSCGSHEDGIDHGVADTSVVQPVTANVRKKFRRKSLFKNRNEGSGSLERPKKRHMENNDMFGLDKLIGILSGTDDSNDSIVGVGDDVG
ncbi:hypothetical protein Hanom_Chr04g00357881 [Helianthus anomalus]